VKIIRVFPRRTKATPDDKLAIVGRTPELFDEADEVHISVAWTWDLPLAERLSSAWKHVAPVKIGGPATGMAGGEFVPGMYLRHGYTITSRGCPNRCWFCSVWRRDGGIREMPIKAGWNVLDDNLLACSSDHIKAVFAMLKDQPQAAEFTGGLEAKRMQPWIAEALYALRPKQMFFAYDTPDDLEPLVEAGKLLISAGFTTASHALRCYVLCGYQGDTFDAAEKRMEQTIAAGFFPMAMLFRDKGGVKPPEWSAWQRTWARPHIVALKIKEYQTC
jgi:hypothetical protein